MTAAKTKTVRQEENTFEVAGSIWLAVHKGGDQVFDRPRPVKIEVE